VWTPRSAASLNLGTNPSDPTGTLTAPIVRCRYLDGPVRGTTPKFDCVLSDGEIVKVKYGHTGEIPAEVAASRLLTALGFGADQMFLVPRLRCYGCVRTPFYTYWLLDKLRARDLLVRSIPADSYTDFEWPSVERHFDGVTIEAGQERGWAWFELEPIDSSLGANRDERDALRLAAVLLASLCADQRPRRHVRTEQVGPGSLDETADLDRCGALHGQHAARSVWRQHVSRRSNLGSRTPAHFPRALGAQRASGS
jgi:hypothetical protein